MTAPGDTDARIEFCTLGMFIIDDIELSPGEAPVKDILGGAGSWAAIGARIMSPPPLSRSIGWIVDAGNDFPPDIRKLIASWQTSCLMRETPDRPTTRGWNGYGENEQRAFKYVTPKIRLDHTSLNPSLLASKSFHFICSPSRCIELVQNIMAKRMVMQDDHLWERPILIWEPVPDLCKPDELENCYEAVKYVDIVSPNHNELCAFFGGDGNTASGSVDKAQVEHCSKALLKSGVGRSRNGGLVVRAGKEGCFILNESAQAWLPAYHQDSTKVCDPTGGGNAFLGGLAVGLVRQNRECHAGSLYRGALWGSVAASFAIEQLGMPKVEGTSDGHEKWNGSDAFARLEELKRRL